MKKIMLAFIAMVVLGASSLSGKVIGVYSFFALSTEGSNPYEWQELYNPNHVTYNAQSDKYITNATFRGEGLTYSVVVAESFSDITQYPIVGASTVDAQFLDSFDTTISGYPARAFRYYHGGDMAGLFTSHYNTSPYNTYDHSRFLRYP